MRLSNKSLAILAFLAGAASAESISAQSGQADARKELLERMTGHWVARGVIARQQTTHDLDAKWVLDKEYVQIHEVSREKDAGGKPQYEALIHVVWDPKAGEYAALWLDTTGIANFPPEGVGHAKPASGDNIQFLFTDPTGGNVHTTFSYERAKESWLWTIDNESNGKLTPFARLVLTRK